MREIQKKKTIELRSLESISCCELADQLFFQSCCRLPPLPQTSSTWRQLKTIHHVVSKTFTIHTESSQEMPSVHMKPLKTNHCRLHYILCAIVSIKKSEESNVSCRKHECRLDMLCGDFRIAFKVG